MPLLRDMSKYDLYADDSRSCQLPTTSTFAQAAPAFAPRTAMDWKRITRTAMDWKVNAVLSVPMKPSFAPLYPPRLFPAVETRWVQVTSGSTVLQGRLVEVGWAQRPECDVSVWDREAVLVHPPQSALERSRIPGMNVHEQETSTVQTNQCSFGQGRTHKLHPDCDFGIPGPHCIKSAEILHVLALKRWKDARVGSTLTHLLCLVLRRTCSYGKLQIYYRIITDILMHTTDSFKMSHCCRVFYDLMMSTPETQLTII